MLARDLLRYCALEALRPSSLLTQSSPVFPTLAGKYVADSRIDPVDALNAEERRPIVGVFTEAEHLEPIAQHGGLLYSAYIDLVFELSVVTNFPDPNNPGQVIVDFADTDAAVEAMLSSLEDSVYFCLHYGPTGALFRQMVKLGDKANTWHSEPHRSGEEAIRLGRRCVTFHVRMKESCYEAAPSGTPANLLRLPPALQSVATALGNSSYIASLVGGIANAASVMPSRTDLLRVGFNITAESLDGVDMVDVLAEIQSKFATVQTTATGGAVVLDYSAATTQRLILAGNVTSLSVVNWPVPGKTGRLIIEITNTGAFSIAAWNGALWSGGTLPLITQGANKRDVVVLSTDDQGATTYGNVVGQDYA